MNTEVKDSINVETFIRCFSKETSHLKQRYINKFIDSPPINRPARVSPSSDLNPIKRNKSNKPQLQCSDTLSTVNAVSTERSTLVTREP